MQIIPSTVGHFDAQRMELWYGLLLTFTSWQPLVRTIDAHIENHVSQKLLNNPGFVGYWFRLALFQLIHWREFWRQLLPIVGVSHVMFFASKCLVRMRPYSKLNNYVFKETVFLRQPTSMQFTARPLLGGERIGNLTYYLTKILSRGQRSPWLYMSIPYDSIVFYSARFYSVLFCYETVVLCSGHISVPFLTARCKDLFGLATGMCQVRGRRLRCGKGNAS